MPAAKAEALGGSSSAPVLSERAQNDPRIRDSPYAAVVSKAPPPRKGPWHPPPGAFNVPELPQFAGPGPGRYTPANHQTKPRVVASRFGSEDRFKYLAPMSSLERTSSGLTGGLNAPQSSTSPGPAYLPDYSQVIAASRSSSFTARWWSRCSRRSSSTTSA